jgi:superfamily I DNA and RNA helicase
MSGFVDGVFTVYGQIAPKYEEINPLSERNRLRAADALELIRSGGQRLRHAAILVDEVQDLWPEEVRLVASLTERMMFAGDSHQRLHDVSGGIEAAKGIGCTEVTLKHHFRISPQICRVADNILVQGNYPLSQYCHYRGPPPSEPLVRSGLSRPDQLDRLVESLDLQLDTYNSPNDLLGVVTWRMRDCEQIFRHLVDQPRFAEITRLHHSGIQDRQFDPGCKICVVTIQSCKGLEFRALHWMFADENEYFTTRDRAYTVVTRAKSSLTVYHDGALSAVLTGAFPPVGRALFEDDPDSDG